MENKDHTHPSQQKKSPWVWFFFGILPILSGVLDILLSFNVIEYIDIRPSRIAIFNDPHRWEVTLLGATLLFFGIANLLPARMKFLARVNNYLLLASFSAVVVGVVLQKIK